MAQGYAWELSRTLALSNEYLMRQVERSGLCGLATSHGDILVQLFAHDRICMSGLSERIARDPSTTTALVKKLAALGLVQTEKSPSDRRSTIVSLTEEGRSLQRDFEAISNKLEQVWHAGISDEDLQTLQKVLSQVRENFREALEEDEAEAAFGTEHEKDR